jgi:hypothetical protein
MKKGAQIGPNGVFGRFMDVFCVFMTKKCTKTNNFGIVRTMKITIIYLDVC